jgi:poly(A) polymerase
MPTFSLEQHRKLALEVVQKLRAAGHQAYWAGGCVRDQLLGRDPKDYDVASSAEPDEIRELFGKRRTLAIGASFGVITVLGPKEAGMVEVATFRRDATYSDGRHPDAVEFTNAEEDARRRDFTINALFLDPVDNRVIDFVEGQQDIEAQVIRAVGDANQRIDEDKLRMLRAVRFAAVFGFEIEAETLAAVKRHAAEISVVSAERIAEELRRMIVDANRAQAVQLLRETGLLSVVLPELTDTIDKQPTDQLLSALENPTFPLALAALLSSLDSQAVRKIANRLKLSNDDTDRAAWLVYHQGTCHKAETMAWHQLQPILTHPGASDLIALDAARAQGHGLDLAGVELCRTKLLLPPETLDPVPLLSGEDLIQHGVPRGKIYRTLLEKVRAAQLDGEIHTRNDALTLVNKIVEKKST